MNSLTFQSRLLSRGFTLIEFLFVAALLSIILGAVFSQIDLAQQRTRSEQLKVDIFQESREFVDQIGRDVHQAGYPALRMFDTTAWLPALASPAYNDSRVATGITLIAPNQIQFEGDVDGDGYVDIVEYVLQPTGTNCPCLQRSQVLKSVGGTALSNQVQNVQSAGTASDPIFTAFTALGTTVTNADMITAVGRQALASIKTVHIQLKVKSSYIDPKTALLPETTLSTQVGITNCSLAAAGQMNSC